MLTAGTAITRGWLRGAGEHARRLMAARILLEQWGKRAAYVAFARDNGRHVPMVEPHAVAPDGAAWSIAADEADEILVATVAAGARYQGWDEAMRQARMAEGKRR